MSITVGTVSEEHSDYQRTASSPSGLPADRAIPSPAGPSFMNQRHFPRTVSTPKAPQFFLQILTISETLPETAPLP